MKSLRALARDRGVVEGVAGGVGQARDTGARWCARRTRTARRASPAVKVRLIYAGVCRDEVAGRVERGGLCATKVAVAMNCDSSVLVVTLTSE